MVQRTVVVGAIAIFIFIIIALALIWAVLQQQKLLTDCESGESILCMQWTCDNEKDNQCCGYAYRVVDGDGSFQCSHVPNHTFTKDETSPCVTPDSE